MKPGKSGVKEIESPSGLDLSPQPPASVRLSKRAGILALLVVFGVVASVGYGIMTRSGRTFQVGYRADESKALTAATDAGKAITAQISSGAAVPAGDADRQADALHGAEDGVTRPALGAGGAKLYAPVSYAPTTNPPQYREPTPEERRLAVAYEREMQAMDSPTTLQAMLGSGFGRPAGPGATAPDSGGVPLTSLLRSLQSATATAGAPSGPSTRPPEEDESQNMQDAKERFLARARTGPTDNYLKSRNTKPVGTYEVKAGWDIPAVLEQALNSDLPGEMKALVRENVYNTATGEHLLIPQGARLVGTYDSRVAYGQDGIQVVWSRLIFPDGSSIDLEGMAGQDAAGFSGLRHDVDNHYKRLLGFGLLTSIFSASFQLSQSRRGTVVAYPSPAETAGSAIGAQISQLGADVTRRNLNVQPTIKVPIGYRFNVRVNRDILFETPYQPATG